MNVHYTGRHVELTGAQRRKLEARFLKMQRILGDRRQPEAHVILSHERRLSCAEVTLNLHHHTLVVRAAGSDLFSVAQEAVEKLEKQIIRNRDKWREKKRRSPKPGWESVPAESPAPGRSSGPRVSFRKGNSNPDQARFRILRTATPSPKPLTVEDAVLEMEQKDRDCVVYRDAEDGHFYVLFRRRDGNLELAGGRWSTAPGQ